jgi:hypothetical protein
MLIINFYSILFTITPKLLTLIITAHHANDHSTLIGLFYFAKPLIECLPSRHIVGDDQIHSTWYIKL